VGKCQLDAHAGRGDAGGDTDLAAEHSTGVVVQTLRPQP